MNTDNLEDDFHEWIAILREGKEPPEELRRRVLRGVSEFVAVAHRIGELSIELHRFTTLSKPTTT
jgi:hypothetical protein